MDNKVAFWEEDKFLPLIEIERKIEEIIKNDLITKENDRKFKKFYEEIMPLAFLARKLNASAIQFTDDTKKCESYDAIFKFTSGEDKNIEVTCAIDEKQFPLKNNHLEKYGFVSACSDVKYTKEKKKKKIIKQSHFISVEGNKICEKKLTQILEAYNHKNGLKRETYIGAILLILVDVDGTNITKLSSFVAENIHDIFYDTGIFDRIFLISKNPSKYTDFFMEI